MTGRYRDRAASLATMHGKEAALEPPFRALGTTLVVPGVDTDLLGTFSGEIERPAPPREVVARKARLGLEAAGLPLGLATEGTFGPHPAAPLLTVHREVALFVDDELGIEVEESIVEPKPALLTTLAGPDEPLDRVLAGADFPAHALLVMPSTGPRGGPVHKGIRDLTRLRAAIRECASAAPDGRARVETDLRAHCNPTRMAVIAALGTRLAARLARECHACGTPGWGMLRLLPGFACADCDRPTALIRAELHGCVRCDATREIPLARSAAEPRFCENCNP